MSHLHTSFVLGYHGCCPEVGERVLAGEVLLIPSDEKYDWLGPGIYFWEADPQRAWEWAEWKVKRGDYKKPFVVGAVIDLGNCLDLMSRSDLEVLIEAYAGLDKTRKESGILEPLPENRRVGDDDEDMLLRFRDCAVIRHLHRVMDAAGEPFHTVRGLFTEGKPLFPGSGFRSKTHVQVAVRDPRRIRGYFRTERP